LLALDLPGHGQSTNASSPEGYTLPNLAAAVASVLDQLGIAELAVFGWSLGGHIAVELMAHTSAVSGLMLTGTPPVAKGPLGMLRGFRPSRDVLLGTKLHFSARDAVRFFRMCYGETADDGLRQALARSDEQLRTSFLKSMMRGDGQDQKQLVETADIPIAIVNGAGEPVARLSYLESLAIRNLWDGQCIVIPGAGHSPFWQQADRFNGLLARFVEDVAASRCLAHQRCSKRA